MNTNALSVLVLQYPIVENTPKAQLAIPLLKSFTYFGFSKSFCNTLRTHICQCLSAIPLYIGVTHILIVSLLICFNEQDQVPCNTFILFFPCHFRPLGVYRSGNQIGRCRWDQGWERAKKKKWSWDGTGIEKRILSVHHPSTLVHWWVLAASLWPWIGVVKKV